MSLNGLTRLLAVAVLLPVAQGCRVPPVPEHARGPDHAAGYEDGVPPTRISNGAVEQPSERPQASGTGVVPASAVEPLPMEKNPQADRDVPGERYASDEDEDSGFQLSDFAPSKLIGDFREMAGMGPNEEEARALYKEGEEQFGRQQFAEAAGPFKSAAAQWPDSPLEEDALFMAAESYFFSDQYPEANDHYQKLLKKYEHSRHLDKAVARLFSIGRYWEQMYEADPHWPITPNMLDESRPTFDTFGYAIKAYDAVRMSDPTGPLADDSIMATGNAMFLRGRYEEAAYQYDLVRKEYPDSEHQVAAHLLGMKSNMAMYQGPMYDGGPLKTAGEIADQAMTQFRTELGEQRDLVLKTKNRVTEEQAAREWAMAQYYDKKSCYGAARVYYKAIIEDYPQTGAAQQATARLAEIQGLPDSPPNRFKWLTNAFPSSTESVGQGVRKPAALKWMTDLLQSGQKPSEEFRDEQSP